MTPAERRAGFDKLVLDLQALQAEAHRLGLLVTAQGLNRCMNAAGWELAEGGSGMASLAINGRTMDHKKFESK